MNPSMVDSNELHRGNTSILKSDSILHILSGKYAHKVQFLHDEHNTNSPRTNSNSLASIFLPRGTKRKIDSGYKESSEAKRVKRDLTKEEEKERQLKHKLERDNNPGSDTKRLKTEDIKEEEEDEDLDEETKEIQRKLKAFQNMASPSKKPEKQETNTSISSKPSTPGPSYQASTRPSTGSSKNGMPNADDTWEQRETLLTFTSAGVEASAKIAGFDIDGCIITTQSGKVFPTHIGDWRLLYGEIPGKLKKLRAEGYKIVFFTNQMGIQRGKLKVEDFKGKIHNIIRKLNIPVQVFVSTGKGPYRKPGLGMWKYLTQDANDGIAVDMDASMYIGDAAGRPADWEPKKKKDFSCSDRLFALNAGLKFHTPEEFFRGHKPAKFNLPEFDPRALSRTDPLLEPLSASIRSGKQEIIVLVGYPASGKSHFARSHFVKHGYVRINRDKLGSWQKCVAAATKAVKDGKSVVVDNTSPDEESRKRYTDVGKANNVPCRCFILTGSLQHARHNERYREMTDKSHQPINDMVMNSYRSKFKEPSLSENFTEIVKVNFVPDFTSTENEALYRTFLLEK